MMKTTKKKICLVSIIFIFSHFIYNPQLSFDDEVELEESTPNEDRYELLVTNLKVPGVIFISVNFR